MDADADAAVLQMRHAHRVVDFGRLGVVDRKRFDLRLGEFRCGAHFRRRKVRREAGPLREVLRVEAIDVPGVGARDRAQCEKKLQGRLPRRRRGVRERLPFDAVLVGRDQKRHRHAADGLGETPLGHLRRPGAALLFLLPTALHRLQRLLQDVGGGALVDAAALPVEVDGVPVEDREERGALHRARTLAPIFRREVRVAEFRVGGSLPEERRIEFGRGLRNTVREFRGRRARKFEKGVRRLHLGAAARDELDLIGRTRLREDRARLEGAVFFKVEIHGSS